MPVSPTRHLSISARSNVAYWPFVGYRADVMSAITRYVALGDSFTEGIGDPDPASNNGLRGWADLVAAHLACHNSEFGYANLAIRGHTMDAVIAGQIKPAIMLQPDLITIYAGINDLLKLRADLDAMMARYALALSRLRRTGARVMTFTAADIGTVPVFRRLRGRAAIYNELLRGIVDDLGLELVDFWRFTEFRDPRMWDSDRVHLGPIGHRRMAGRVLDALAVPHSLSNPPDPAVDNAGRVTRLRSDLQWAASFAAPWVIRRLRRVTPGAGVQPKLSSLTTPMHMV
jgi:lysophospholipase L1-like esterase